MAQRPTLKSIRALTQAEMEMASAIGDRIETLYEEELDSDLDEARTQGHQALLRSLARVGYHAENGGYATGVEQGADPRWDGIEHSPENLQKFVGEYREETVLLTDPARRGEINRKVDELINRAQMLDTVGRLRAFAEMNGLKLSASTGTGGDGPGNRTARFLPTSTAIGVNWKDAKGNEVTTAQSAADELTAMYLLALEISGKTLQVRAPGRQERQIRVPELT